MNDERLGDRQRPRVEMSDRGWGAARGGVAGHWASCWTRAAVARYWARAAVARCCCGALGGARAGGPSVRGGGARGGAVE
ncbi:hypothetical protein ACOSQ2_009950 [Xanthoceras sorbifolium]